MVNLTQSPIPGPVAGMVLLWVSLMIKGSVSNELTHASHGLIQHLSLYFLPAGVGLFFLPDHIMQHWPAVITAMIGGTFASMLFSGWVFKRLHSNTHRSGAGD